MSNIEMFNQVSMKYSIVQKLFKILIFKRRMFDDFGGLPTY